MAFIGAGVEYGLHCLLFLAARAPDDAEPSSRDLAELQRIPVEYAAKIFTRLQKAGVLHASEGVRGGLRLARDPAAITVHDVVVAIDGEQPLFGCREIRARCAVFDDAAPPPGWATQGVCAIHAVMLRAEREMRDALRAVTLADLGRGFEAKAPARFLGDVSAWLDARAGARAMRSPRSRRSKP